MQNGNTTSKEEPVLNGKDDIHDDRVPCEFCGELRCKETIMRHQVCKLFGKTIMVFLLDNYLFMILFLGLRQVFNIFSAPL